MIITIFVKYCRDGTTQLPNHRYTERVEKFLAERQVTMASPL